MNEDITRFLDAISYAVREHQGRFRKDEKTPYAAHPCRVAAILSHVFQVDDPDMLAAAALHDTIEDTPTDRDDLIDAFGERVAAYVAALTKDMRLPEKEREPAFLEQIARAGPEVMVLKLADAYDNLMDAIGLSPAQLRKTRAKARKQLDAFKDRLGPEWEHVVRRFQALLDGAPEG
jgi:guanosine-3',5'-bis(diphosphate) 3'-pyrophosphohydrolase